PVEGRALELRLGLFGDKTVIAVNFETLVGHFLGILSTLDCQWKGAWVTRRGTVDRVTGVAIGRHSFSEFSHLLLGVLLTYHGQPILVRGRSRTSVWTSRSTSVLGKNTRPSNGSARLIAIFRPVASRYWCSRSHINSLR